MLKFETLASGSNGNAVLVGDEQTNILIDAGISAKRITSALVESGVFPTELSGIFITHEHTDHIGGLKVFSGKYDLPVYASRGTMKALLGKGNKFLDTEKRFIPVESGETITIRSLRITPFSTSHDAEEPLAYRVESGESSAVVFTDTGVCDEAMMRYLKEADILYLESNHDVHMLECGSYPYQLKRRILGLNGHLSNEDAAEVLEKVISPKLKVLILAHLSEENNYPDLARLNMENKLAELHRKEDVELIVAERNARTKLVKV